jgi:lipoyl(octanoyl) transferase
VSVVSRNFDGIWLGRRSYAPVLELQERLHAARRAGEIGDTVLFVEHEPVLTFGRGAKAEHVLLSEAELARVGMVVAHTGRGGDVTVHVPGQLVCYPVFDLAPDRCDVRRYVRDLAEVMRRVVAEYGVAAGTIDRYIGLWVDRESPGYWAGAELALDPVKIGAIGVKISRWVTMHGFALNVAPDLDFFRYIVPCGISEHGVSSVEVLSSAHPALRDVAERALVHLADIFGARANPLRDAPAELSSAAIAPRASA